MYWEKLTAEQIKEYKANSSEIGVLFSQDTHYSVPKGINLLQLKPICISVDKKTRIMKEEDIII